jgi:hypothetical protein
MQALMNAPYEPRSADLVLDVLVCSSSRNRFQIGRGARTPVVTLCPPPHLDRIKKMPLGTKLIERPFSMFFIGGVVEARTVELDEIERLLIGLVRAERITRPEMILLQAAYLREARP